MCFLDLIIILDENGVIDREVGFEDGFEDGFLEGFYLGKLFYRMSFFFLYFREGG